ncbi:MAG TPA: S24/S26 family peptidase [Terriglobales bacterium]|nr:S24/S26 family peptidase [Terriglobales bacterium]
MNRDFPQSLIFEELSSELLASGHAFRFQARGQSMLPVIQDGEILHVWPLREEKLKPGDIILFRGSEKFTAHRIVGTRADGYVTRGDSGIGIDGAVTRDQILGLVVAKECNQSGSVVRLNGLRTRFFFHLREARRRVRFL